MNFLPAVLFFLGVFYLEELYVRRKGEEPEQFAQIAIFGSLVFVGLGIFQTLHAP